MKNRIHFARSRWAWVFCLLLTVQIQAAQFVELTAEIETIGWPLKDGAGLEPDETWSRKLWTVRCIVGSNQWSIATDFVGSTQTWSFTGTNLVLETHVTGYPSKHPDLYARNHPEAAANVGKRLTNQISSADGNLDAKGVLPVSSVEKISFLAFCSGSFLKRPGRQLPLPSPFWCEYICPFGPSDNTVTFEDGLGLPRGIQLYTTNNLAILQYYVPLSTNVLGWNFPLEFHLAEYRPVGTKGWQLELTANGRLKTIQKRPEP